jgi:hypothetical protein
MTPQVTGLVPQIKISGREFAALLKNASATENALIDLDLRTGRMVVVGTHHATWRHHDDAGQTRAQWLRGLALR